MKYLLLFLLAGCLLGEDYGNGTDGPGIVTTELTETSTKIKWRDLDTEQLIVIDSNAFYYYYELRFYNAKSENKQTELFSLMGLIQFFKKVGEDRYLFDTWGAANYLPEGITPLEFIINYQYIKE